MCKKITAALIIILLLCNSHMALTEEKTIQGLTVSPPDNWYFSVTSDNTATLYDSMNGSVIQIYVVPFISIIPQEQRAYVEAAWKMFDETMRLEIIKLSLDLTYENTQSEIRTIDNKPIVYAHIDSSQIGDIPYDMSIVMMMIEDNIIGIAGTNMLTNDGESICLEAISWLHPAIESNTVSLNDSSSNITVSSSNALLSIKLDENEYTIITATNSSDSISVQRTNIPASKWDTYMSLSNKEMMIAPAGKDPTEYAVNVRIKENKYPEIGNIANLSALESRFWMESLIAGFNVDKYESYETEQALYCVFDVKISSYEKRYATIYDDDMVYIWLSSPEPITEDDEIFLRKIVDQFVYK